MHEQVYALHVENPEPAEGTKIPRSSGVVWGGRVRDSPLPDSADLYGLARHLLIGELPESCIGFCMFNSHTHNIALFIYVYIDIFTYLFRLMDPSVGEFDMSSIRMLHGVGGGSCEATPYPDM